MTKMTTEIRNNRVYTVVLTGGPCGGKTTGQARLCSFFENLGWKVYRVPETATVLIAGGVKFSSLTEDEANSFQENLLKTMLLIETTFRDLAASSSNNCLVICDRGAMDAAAYMKPEDWVQMCKKNKWNNVELRDGRYNQVIHMVSAAKGAEHFYDVQNHVSRTEGIELARHLDDLTAQAWVGHPYYDVIDNCTDFEHKVVRMIAAVCNRLSIDTGDRLAPDSKKRKFLVVKIPDDAGWHVVNGGTLVAASGVCDENGISIVNSYPQFQDFTVIHDYLVTPNQKQQARVRKRGQNGNWTYTHTIRRPEINDESPEVRTQIGVREYEMLLAQRDGSHLSIHKKRRCFLWDNHYFQLDIYQEPCLPKCKGLMILETFTTLIGDELQIPSFLEISHEITGEQSYSMYYLSSRDSNAGVPSKRMKGLMTNGIDADHVAHNGDV